MHRANYKHADPGRCRLYPKEMEDLYPQGNGKYPGRRRLHNSAACNKFIIQLLKCGSENGSSATSKRIPSNRAGCRWQCTDRYQVSCLLLPVYSTAGIRCESGCYHEREREKGLLRNGLKDSLQRLAQEDSPISQNRLPTRASLGGLQQCAMRITPICSVPPVLCSSAEAPRPPSIHPCGAIRTASVRGMVEARIVASTVLHGTCSSRYRQNVAKRVAS